MTDVRIILDDAHRVQIHEYDAVGGVPRAGDVIELNTMEYPVNRVVWVFDTTEHRAPVAWIDVFVEPRPGDR